MGQAPIVLQVHDDLAAMAKTLTRIQREALPAAVVMALNRVGASTRAAAVKAMAEATGLKQKDIRDATSLRKASRGKETVEIAARGRPVNMIRFLTAAGIASWLNAKRRPRRPIKAKPWGVPREYAARVFIGNQGRTVFIRDAGSKRKQIRGLWGPSIATELLRDATRGVAEKRFAERWPVEFARAMAQAERRVAGAEARTSREIAGLAEKLTGAFLES